MGTLALGCDVLMASRSVTPFLLVGATLFCLGIFTVITRKNAVAVLMGVELILNAANINFVAFQRMRVVEQANAAIQQPPLSGHVFAIFVIILAAAEAAVALAIVLSIYRNFHTSDVDQATLMKG
ncbi:MAG: NADH-quinone oxidoreductase subunit NuoK [Planctomycetota bacterium]